MFKSPNIDLFRRWGGGGAEGFTIIYPITLIYPPLELVLKYCRSSIPPPKESTLILIILCYEYYAYTSIHLLLDSSGHYVIKANINHLPHSLAR